MPTIPSYAPPTTPLVGNEFVALWQADGQKGAQLSDIANHTISTFATDNDDGTVSITLPVTGQDNVERVLPTTIGLSGRDGATMVGFAQASPGSGLRVVEAKLGEMKSPSDFLGVGDINTDDTTAVNLAIAATGDGGCVYLPAGMNYRVTALSNARSIGFSGDGTIVTGQGNATTALRSYARRSGFIHGREYRYRLFARIASAGTNLVGLLDGDSTMARGNTTVIGGIVGNLMTISDAAGATLAPGTYVTAISPTCRIMSQNSGTQFGAGIYVLSETGSVASGSGIELGNGGGFAGVGGEPQVLLKKHMRRYGVRNNIVLTNIAIGGSTWQDLASRSRAQYLTPNTDILIVKAPVNKGPSIAADIASMRQYFSDIRAAQYGRIDLLTIVLIGYTPTGDTVNGRTSFYAQQMRQACLQLVDDFQLVYHDPHGIFTDGSWMVGLYLDNEGKVHPQALLQQQIYPHVGEAIISANEAQMSTGDDWISLAPAGSYLTYDNGFGVMRTQLKLDGSVGLIGGVRPTYTDPSVGGTITANDNFAFCPNTNYYPDTAIVFQALALKAGGALAPLWCGVDVAGRIFSRETATGVVAVIFSAGTGWPGWTVN